VAALFRIIGRYPLVAFMVIGLGAGFLSPAVRPIAGAEVLPLVCRYMECWNGYSASVSADLCSLERTRDGKPLLILLSAVSVISLAIYGSKALAPPEGGWPRALAEEAAVFVLQLGLFGLPKRSDSPGFFSTIGRTDITP
jgi:hypothetical protein